MIGYASAYVSLFSAYDWLYFPPAKWYSYARSEVTYHPLGGGRSGGAAAFPILFAKLQVAWQNFRTSAKCIASQKALL